jgi:hypothetical protein
MTEKPLFIPLKGEYYDAFVRGEKTTEYRPYGPRWNERVCRVGRPVVLSRGYGKRHRRHGTITEFRIVSVGLSRGSVDFLCVYGYDALGPIAEIDITLNGRMD